MPRHQRAKKRPLLMRCTVFLQQSHSIETPQRATSTSRNLPISKIVLGPIWSRVETKERNVLDGLYASLRFRAPSFIHVARKMRMVGGRRSFARLGAWDGYTNFFNISRKEGASFGTFPTGLFQQVKYILDKYGVSVQIVDMRPKHNVTIPEVTEDTLKDANLQLRDYQIEIANIALKEKQGIVKCATGGGKTLIFASMIKAFDSKVPTMILFRNKSLVAQTYDVLQRCNIPNIGRVNMDFTEPALITCTTIQSLPKLVDQIPKTRALIVDEVHQFASSKSIQTLRLFENATWRLGFSATPLKTDDHVHNCSLTGFFGRLLCDVTTEDLTKRSILADAVIRIYPIDHPKGIRGLGWTEAEEAGIAENMHFHRSVAELVSRIPEGRILILVKRLSHGDHLQKLIPDAYWIKGEDDAETRNTVLDQLRKSTKKKVVAIMSAIGYIGVDVFVHHLINATGGRDANQTIQKLGRGLRKATDKESVVYHDFMLRNNVLLEQHSVARVETLKLEGHPIHFEPAISPSPSSFATSVAGGSISSSAAASGAPAPSMPPDENVRKM